MITLFQHGKDEPAGEIEIYLNELRVPFLINPIFMTGSVPGELPSGLIILGGQMSVNDTGSYPWLIKERQMIRDMVASGRPVLGICLGAQMIASAFGNKVYRDTCERGWVDIHGYGSSEEMRFPESFAVFHWHNETFTLPEGAEILATGDVITNQAFRYDSAVGVQYHPEVTMKIISQWTRECHEEERKKILQESEQYYAMNQQHCHTLIDHFLRGWDR